MNPNKPIYRGGGQRPDIFFQSNVAAQKFYSATPDIVQDIMDNFYAHTGRKYKLYDYYGHPEAEKMIVSMCSSTDTIMETVDYLNSKGEKVGLMNVRLFRPWSFKHFIKEIPETVTKIAVLDRTREEGAAGMPLYLDVLATIAEKGNPEKYKITGGQYGISGKEFNPGMVKAVFDNLDAPKPKNNYVLGIKDDVTNTSLNFDGSLNTTPNDTKQYIFWGLGSDGTVGSNKSAIGIIANNTDWKVQGAFSYDAYKTDGLTLSNLRFSPKEIRSNYKITSGADYISCNKNTFANKFDLLKPLKQEGIFVLNSPWNTVDALEKNLSNKLKRQIAQKRAKFYNIDAAKISHSVGLGKRINIIMQTVFYLLSGILPIEKAIALFKADIDKMYGSKGAHVSKMNKQAIDKACSALKQVNYPSKWLDLPDDPVVEETPGVMKDVIKPLLQLKGNELPVSKFVPGGYIMESGLTQYEKRGIAHSIPIWDADKCTQCNNCSILCPHSAIRPFLLDKNDIKSSPEGFTSKKADGNLGYNFRIQVSPMDCTGCQICSKSCPDNAIPMKPFEEHSQKQAKYWMHAVENIKPKKVPLDKYSVKGSQFNPPLFEFSGACAGCGETPYFNLLTQLFGERMVIANATGCSRVWSTTYPHIPFRTTDKGRGPAYGHSLLEDNAEFGFGIVKAYETRRSAFENHVHLAMPQLDQYPELKKMFENWLKNKNDAEQCDELISKISKLLEDVPDRKSKSIDWIKQNTDLITVRSFWLIGGDGWAYDIGFGGVDHVLSTESNFNILVYDTEMYSNTGGQVSKATSFAASVKFNLGGKKTGKKDLGLLAIPYEHVYVASISLGANQKQAIQALKEAESYSGPSLVLCLSPCISWGSSDMSESSKIQTLAVESGYWPLYRYDPRKKDKAFQYDSPKIKCDVTKFLESQDRFTKLMRESPETAKVLQAKLRQYIKRKNEIYRKMSMDEVETLDFLKKKLGETIVGDKILILYGSETGNTQKLAENFAIDLKRRGVRATCVAMDDFDFEELPDQDKVYALISTAGQGVYPSNSTHFMKTLHENHPKDFLHNVKFAVFGLGDSSYVYFNKSANDLDKRLEELGAQRIVSKGLGNDRDPDKFETEWNNWAPNLFVQENFPQPPDELTEPFYSFNIAEGDNVEEKRFIPPGAELVPLTNNKLLTPEKYDRDIRHYEFDIGKTGWQYSPGDVLAIYPHNNIEDVRKFLDEVGINPSEYLELHPQSAPKVKLPEPVKVEQLFSQVLDIFGTPKRRFYDYLGITAKDENEKTKLKRLLTKEGQEELKAMKDETVTYADLLKMFPSTNKHIEYLLDYVPYISPRLYSIASSQEMMKDNLQLCIVLNDWTTPSKKYRVGTTTSYLRALKANADTIACKVQQGACSYPESHLDPLVMVGLGTGLAPLRALIQERAMAKAGGAQVGPMALYFGARYKKTEYLYQDEFEKYHADGLLTALRPAFSRDQKHKIYVQDKMKEDHEMLYDMLVKKKGTFYLCGSARAQDTNAELINAFMKVGKMSKKQAEDYITQMRMDHRYHLDIW